LWDVRQAQQPYQTIAGHDKGITALQWNKLDDRLLLTGGKDGRSCIFDVTDGELIGEMPRQPGFCISAKFNRRHLDLITIGSIEGGTQIYNMMGEPTAPKLQRHLRFQICKKIKTDFQTSENYKCTKNSVT